MWCPHHDSHRWPHQATLKPGRPATEVALQVQLGSSHWKGDGIVMRWDEGQVTRCTSKQVLLIESIIEINKHAYSIDVVHTDRSFGMSSKWFADLGGFFNYTSSICWCEKDHQWESWPTDEVLMFFCKFLIFTPFDLKDSSPVLHGFHSFS